MLSSTCTVIGISEADGNSVDFKLTLVNVSLLINRTFQRKCKKITMTTTTIEFLPANSISHHSLFFLLWEAWLIFQHYLILTLKTKWKVSWHVKIVNHNNSNFKFALLLKLNWFLNSGGAINRFGRFILSNVKNNESGFNSLIFF